MAVPRYICCQSWTTCLHAKGSVRLAPKLSLLAVFNCWLVLPEFTFVVYIHQSNQLSGVPDAVSHLLEIYIAKSHCS